MAPNGRIWLFATLIAALLGSAPAVRPADVPVRPLRVTFFYNTSIFKDPMLLEQTLSVFTNVDEVAVLPVPYADSNEFVEKCKNQLAGSNAPDTFLGPSDSDSLKSLDKSLAAKVETPFLAPFVTTKPSDYTRLTLISASASDDKRVRAAVEQFAKYTAQIALGCVFTDDTWGQGVASAFRDALQDRAVTVFTQPVKETESDPVTGVRGRKKNSKLYQAFLEQCWNQGARILAVALLDSKSVNELLAALAKLNRDSWLNYQPTILLLNEPTFDEAGTGRGILPEYAREFRLVYVREQILSTNLSSVMRPIFSHLDSCKVLVAVGRMAPPRSTDAPARCAAVPALREFYSGGWDDERYQPLRSLLMTGFHRSIYWPGSKDIEVIEAVKRGKQVGGFDVNQYFEKGYYRQILWRVWFFMSHHPSLWRMEIVLPFAAVCFGSLLHMVWFGAMKPLWLIWRTRSFWLLFLLNLSLTYCAWVVSVRYGVFSERSWVAPLALALLCPSAASALSELAKRFLPMLDVSIVAKVLNEMTKRLQDTIGKTELADYQRWLVTLECTKLKAAFQEVLFMETLPDAVRTRLISRLRKDLESVGKDDLAVDVQQRSTEIYAEALVQLVAYVSTSREDFCRRMQELFPEPTRPARIESAGQLAVAL